MEQETSPKKFSILKLVSKGIFTKYVYNSEKMVVRPSQLYAFWIHHSKYRTVSNATEVQLTSNYSIILHLARKASDRNKGKTSISRHVEVLGHLVKTDHPISGIDPMHPIPITSIRIVSISTSKCNS
uniref:Uncharacterized protein n=1 Tax=Ditylenchus dipsaci TaxID=166011 RepID=A0A915ENZ9_9BILA